MPRRPNYGFQKQQKDLQKQKKREEKNEKKRLKSEAAAAEDAAQVPTKTEGED